MIGQTGGNPAAFTAGDKVVPKPSLHEPIGRDRSRDRAQHRQLRRRPPDHDDAGGALGPTRRCTTSACSTDVLPFKRMSAFDDVGTNYARRPRTALTEVRVGSVTDKRAIGLGLGAGQTRPARTCRCRASPDMRITPYGSSRGSRCGSKDSADFFVRNDGSSACTYRPCSSPTPMPATRPRCRPAARLHAARGRRDDASELRPHRRRRAP
jgi:hypothetical protein